MITSSIRSKFELKGGEKRAEVAVVEVIEAVKEVAYWALAHSIRSARIDPILSTEVALSI